MKREFEGFDFTNSRDDSYYARREYINDAPTDEPIAGVEKELGYRLPASYIWLMKRHNGGILFNICFLTGSPANWAENHIAITSIYGVGKEKNYSLCGEIGNQFMTDEWGYPEIGVTAYDCPSVGHNMIFLDYRECGPFGEPKVVHTDQELDFKVTILAENLEGFI